jgi:hypothetical protein
MAFNILWICGLVLQCILACVLIARRMYRHVPLFFSYIAFLAVESIVLYFVRRQSADAYFYAYWVKELLVAPLRVAVIYEVVLSVFAPYGAIQKLMRLCALWALIVLVLLAGFVAVDFPASNADGILNVVLMLDRSLRIVDVGLLLLLFMFAYFLHLRWPHYALGVAIGLALFCSVELVAATVRARFGITPSIIYNVINATSWSLAVVLWTVTFVTSERRREVQAMRPSQLEDWNHALEAMLAR